MRGDGIMAEFPTYEEMAKRVAEKALDEFLYQGKSIREWMKIIAEQEPCEDTISRKAVIDLVVANHTELNGLNVVMYAPFYKDIIQLPSVRPQEPKIGHWKRIGYDIYECSICGQNVMTGDICAYKHCHGCGAKMKDGD